MKSNAEQNEMAHAFQEMVNEHLQGLNSDLLELERGACKRERSRLLDRALRRCHTLKGSAALVRLQEVVFLIQDLEGVLLMIEAGQIRESRKSFNLLFDSIDVVSSVVHSRLNGGEFMEAAFKAVHHRLRSVLAEPDSKSNLPDPKGKAFGVTEKETGNGEEEDSVGG